MRLISRAPLAVAVSRAGGLGFLGAGNDLTNLMSDLEEAKVMLEKDPIDGAPAGSLPIGIGFINWGADLDLALEAIKKYSPAAVWLFAPRKIEDFRTWVSKIRDANDDRVRIWIQIGTVSDAVEVTKMCNPDVLVVQGSDAGGHGLEQGAGIVSLLPEVSDALESLSLMTRERTLLFAAGGIMDGRGLVAAAALGAIGVVMGTRFLACNEANVAKGYQEEVVRTRDGGVSTVRTNVYDRLRGTTDWPPTYNGRGIINQSFLDDKSGLSIEENKEMYIEALRDGDAGWGPSRRLTTYAGTGVGLVEDVKSAQEILDEIRSNICDVRADMSYEFDLM
ncbi:hypothetical protein MMC09_005272 [Bachmanniomyces sp. S44760]|nr:hypothetical protein [Bachmanniomyces sp. S44760]